MALHKNFKEVRVSVKMVKDRALDISKLKIMDSLATGIKKENEHTLKPFYAAKSHKPGVPFRAIVSKRGSRPAAVSDFLQKCLEFLGIIDPFSVRQPNSVVENLFCVDCFNASGDILDVEDLLCLPHDVRMRHTKDCIKNDNDESAFVNRCGIPMSEFLEQPRFYFRSTVGGFQDRVYVQKSGVCIRSKVATF